MSNRIADIVRMYRERRIEGDFVDLVPFTLVDADNVVAMRNREKNRHFLNQTCIITTASQARWYKSYLERVDDIYWSIYNKQNQFIGTVRIYDINEEKDICDQGSLIIDDDYAEGGLHAIEVEILTLDFVFDVLKIGNVINEDRADNKVMNSLTKKLGFKFVEDVKIGGVDYKYYLLNAEDYKEKREIFTQIIAYWKQR